jgi:hypothetical protein
MSGGMDGRPQVNLETGQRLLETGQCLPGNLNAQGMRDIGDAGKGADVYNAG